MGVFDKYVEDVYQYRYEVGLLVGELHGGVPMDPKVAEGFLRSKIVEKDADIADLLRQTAEDLGFDPENWQPGVPSTAPRKEIDAAVAELANARQTSTFYRPDGWGNGLYIPGRHIKAMLKESANIAFPNERWGPTRKGTKSFFAEHVFCLEEWIPLGRTEPDGTSQRFVATWRGTGIQYDHFVEDVKLGFTIVTDHKFTKAQWAKLWVTAQHNGLGAARSQGYGTFEVVSWQPIKSMAPNTKGSTTSTS